MCRLLILILFWFPALSYAQYGGDKSNTEGSSAITLDNGGSPCSGSGSTNYISCSSAMTLSAGSTIVCGSYGQSGGNNESGAVMDSVNGFYENV
jgi:hypothetical protein